MEAREPEKRREGESENAEEHSKLEAERTHEIRLTCDEMGITDRSSKHDRGWEFRGKRAINCVVGYFSLQPSTSILIIMLTSAASKRNKDAHQTTSDNDRATVWVQRQKN